MGSEGLRYFGEFHTPRLLWENRIHPLKGAEKLGAEFFEKAGIGSLEEARRLPARELVRLEDVVLGRAFILNL